MLNYLVQSTEQLSTVMLLVGAALAIASVAYANRYAWIMRISIFAGLGASIVMAIVKNTTSKIDTSSWNMNVFFITTAAVIAFIIIEGIRSKRKKEKGIIPAIILACIVFLLIFYNVTPFMEMPRTILLSEDTIASSTFILKIVGWILGFILTFVAGYAVFKILKAMTYGKAYKFTIILLLLNAFQQICTAFGIMLTKRIIKNNHNLFVLVKTTSNYSDWFSYAAIGICIVAIIMMFVMAAVQKEPYTNPAEHRRIKAKWMFRKRWCVTGLICFALIISMYTVVSAQVNKKVELSPIEDAEVKDGAVYVPFEKVSDGHLHRFGYTTDSGTVIRFIVIQKPNSSSYGIGLDACDICGETGYYEKDGQVVCNLCDVVMNINTIGFKGGCNPKVIDYSIQNGNIVVPVDGLLEHEKDFKQ